MLSLGDYDEHLDSILVMAIEEPKTQFIVDSIMIMCGPDVSTASDIMELAEKALDLCADSAEFIPVTSCLELMDLVNKTAEICLTIFIQIEIETPIHFSSTLH